mmetsp:Transcript_4894/g.16653  ORF Transcript_4894/g.16653 Transcript_4894/m.16653 type:complete len:234 (+) Transcript_4894:659-1360(+)
MAFFTSAFLRPMAALTLLVDSWHAARSTSFNCVSRSSRRCWWEPCSSPFSSASFFAQSATLASYCSRAAAASARWPSAAASVFSDARADTQAKVTLRSRISSSYLARRFTSSYSCSAWVKSRAKCSSFVRWCAASLRHLFAAWLTLEMRFCTSWISVALRKNWYFSLPLPRMKFLEFSWSRTQTGLSTLTLSVSRMKRSSFLSLDLHAPSAPRSWRLAGPRRENRRWIVIMSP